MLASSAASDPLPDVAEAWLELSRNGGVDSSLVVSAAFGTPVPRLPTPIRPQMYRPNQSQLLGSTYGVGNDLPWFMPPLNSARYGCEGLSCEMMATPCNIIAASGEWITALEQVVYHLRALELQTKQFLKRWIEGVRESSPHIAAQYLFSFDDIVAAIDRAQTEYITVDSPKIVWWLAGSKGRRHAITRITRQLRPIRFAISKAVSCFCGIGWSRRIWHLLHGAHPPKALSCC